MIRDPARLDFAHELTGVPSSAESRAFLHGDSVQRWRRDPGFRVQLADSVRGLALQLGYPPEELPGGAIRS
jgi:hypothetical protein